MSKREGIEDIENEFWIKEKKSIPFNKKLPERFKVHDQLFPCVFCGGEMFGRCLCCQCYFCHGKCEMSIYSEEDIIEELKKRSMN